MDGKSSSPLRLSKAVKVTAGESKILREGGEEVASGTSDVG